MQAKGQDAHLPSKDLICVNFTWNLAETQIQKLDFNNVGSEIRFQKPHFNSDFRRKI